MPRIAKPIPNHRDHHLADVELRFIIRDAREAADNFKDNPSVCGKYLDQVCDASTVLNYRAGLGLNKNRRA